MQLALPFDAASTQHDSSSTRRVSASTLQDSPSTLQGRSALDDPPIVFVRVRRARRYVIRVRRDGSVRVTIPRGGSERAAREFAQEQRNWVDVQRAKLEEERASRPEPPAAVLRALRARAACELPVRLHELAARHGLTVARVSVRNQRWRWGSCSPGGHICLNWRLVAMPAVVRDYVILHELMHLRRMDHSPKFWKLVASACPGHREARAWLRAWDGDLSHPFSDRSAAPERSHSAAASP